LFDAVYLVVQVYIVVTELIWGCHQKRLTVCVQI